MRDRSADRSDVRDLHRYRRGTSVRGAVSGIDESCVQPVGLSAES
jgi:hypothetical protein